MEAYLDQLMHSAPYMPYVVVMGAILLSGFGAPIPEEIPLLLAGLACGTGWADIYLMLPLVMATVIGADAILYFAGRRYGHHVSTFRLFRRFLTPERLHKAEKSFHRHGGKTLLVARFIPGVRAPTFFSAGMFKVPVWKFIAYNGGAAVVSVSVLVLAAYFFADQYEQVKLYSRFAQTTVISSIVAVVAMVVIIKYRRYRQAVARLEARKAERRARADNAKKLANPS